MEETKVMEIVNNEVDTEVVNNTLDVITEKGNGKAGKIFLAIALTAAAGAIVYKKIIKPMKDKKKDDVEWNDATTYNEDDEEDTTEDSEDDSDEE